MTFESLCKIVAGKSLHTPAVNAYEKIETKPHLIKRGDLFVGSDQEMIKQAIENGAYGILHEGDAIMIDKEVAWIQVASIDEALIKLLRFSLLKSDLHFFYLPHSSYDILRQILQKGDVIFLKSDVKEDFHKILKAQNKSLFIGDNQNFLKSIYPAFTTYHDSDESLIKCTYQTLFLSAFTYQEVHYENIKLPSLFLPALNKALHFAQAFDLDFDIEKLTFTDTFQPLFISNRLTIRPFGDSEHVFIVTHDNKAMHAILDYIQKIAKWANILLFLPSGETITRDVSTHHYRQLAEVNDIEVDKFNFILILANYNELTNILQNNKKEQNISLF